MQTITKFLEKGQQSALQMRSILNKRLGFKVEDDSTCDDDHQQVLDHHSCVTLNSFEACLSTIKSFDLDHHVMIKKRKLDHHATSDAECSDHSSKSEEITDGAKVSRERRGCYKRRRTGQTWTVEATNLIDDGYAWRKYGQKEILHTKYPRNYYRCTHKTDQHCQATKQVQQISENPTKYNITYHGQHTCKSLLKTRSIIIDGSLEENSSFYLSFDTKNHPSAKHALTPSLFRSSAYHSNPTIVKQEHTSIKCETPLIPHDLDRDHDHHSGSHIHHQYSSSSDNHPPSSSLSDLTSTGLASTPVSDQSDVISSSAEFYSSAASPYNMDDDELMNLINMDNQYASLDGFWDN